MSNEQNVLPIDALRAATLEYNASLDGKHFGATERIIRAYLSALAPQAGVNAEECSLEEHIMDYIDTYRESLPATKYGVLEWPTVEGIKAAIRAALASHPCTSTPVVSQNAPDLEDKGGEGKP